MSSKTTKIAIGSSIKSHLADSLKDTSFADLFSQEKIKLEIAQLVKGYRQKAGLTQQQLAALCGLHQAAIARIESRSSKSIPSIEMLRKIFIPLGYTVSFHVDKLKRAA
jgi:DNA-binding XRE family transcriptional regulator